MLKLCNMLNLDLALYMLLGHLLMSLTDLVLSDFFLMNTIQWLP